MKISVKHYLNKSLKPVTLARDAYDSDLNKIDLDPRSAAPNDNEVYQDGYPLYMRIRMKGKQTQFKSDFSLYRFQDIRKSEYFYVYLMDPDDMNGDGSGDQFYFSDYSLNAASSEINGALKTEIEMVKAIAQILEKESSDFELRELVYAHSSRIFAKVLQHIISDKAKEKLKIFLVNNGGVDVLNVINWEISLGKLISGLESLKSGAISSFRTPVLDHLNLLESLNHFFNNRPLWFAIWKNGQSEDKFFQYLDDTYSNHSSLHEMKYILKNICMEIESDYKKSLINYHKYYNKIHKK